MIPVVMEPGMKDPRMWEGPLGGKLGTKLHVDLSDESAAALDAGVAQLQRLVGASMDEQRRKVVTRWQDTLHGRYRLRSNLPLSPMVATPAQSWPQGGHSPVAVQRPVAHAVSDVHEEESVRSGTGTESLRSGSAGRFTNRVESAKRRGKLSWGKAHGQVKLEAIERRNLRRLSAGLAVLNRRSPGQSAGGRSRVGGGAET
jgi:hypothetical protein